jgi:protein phosphatase 1 regulatory subunit 7
MVELNMRDKVLDQVNAKFMEEAKDVLYIDLALNSLADSAALAVCTKVMRLNLANNKIKSASVFCSEENFPNLKWLDLSGNKLTEFPALKVPKLEYLDVSGMKIEKINEAWTTHERLRVVKCVDNKFKSLSLFKSMPKLEELYMAQNLITTLSGWENLPNLRKLHLRKNKIDKLPEEDLPELP